MMLFQYLNHSYFFIFGHLWLLLKLPQSKFEGSIWTSCSKHGQGRFDISPNLSVHLGVVLKTQMNRHNYTRWHEHLLDSNMGIVETYWDPCNALWTLQWPTWTQDDPILPNKMVFIWRLWAHMNVHLEGRTHLQTWPPKHPETFCDLFWTLLHRVGQHGLTWNNMDWNIMEQGSFHVESCWYIYRTSIYSGSASAQFKLSFRVCPSYPHEEVCA